jgi:pimeloyl-ACP methyl ester carboxylesterase
MRIMDMGSGPVVVLIPGVQGRWEWMRPAVDALASRCRVITFSLADEPTADAGFEDRLGFDNYVSQVRDAMDAKHIPSAIICGVSYGGLIAAAFARHYPARTAGLILVSALPPGWQPDSRVRFYLRAPRLLSPLFCIGSLRLYPEIAAARGGYVAGVIPGIRHGWNVITHMFSPARMAKRVTLMVRAGLPARICDIDVPTLIVTGEGTLDRVVPVSQTAAYARVCARAETAVIPRTGHLGLITRPDTFAEIVSAFVSKVAAELQLRKDVAAEPQFRPDDVAAELQFRPKDPRRHVG